MTKLVPKPALTPGHYQVLSTLSREGAKSRTELALLLGLSKASITGLVRDLIDQGVLCEREQVFGIGRPSTLLAVRSDAASFIGISLQSDPVVLQLTDLHATTHQQVSIPRLADAQACIDALAEAVARLRQTGGAIARKLAGIGIALPGFVSKDRHTCITSTALGWRDVAIGKLLAERTGLPTWVENDANALILGEELFGTLRGRPDFSMIFVSHGIGCAHFVNGRLLRGHTGGAGEICHAPVAIEGFGAIPCRCGNKGCLETIGSMLAIANAARAAGLSGVPEELVALAGAGHPEAVAILHRAGTAVGLACAQMIQVLDPSHVVVMLDPAFNGTLFSHALLHAAQAHILHRPGARALIEFRDFTPDGFARGAASLAARYFIADHDNF